MKIDKLSETVIGITTKKGTKFRLIESEDFLYFEKLTQTEEKMTITPTSNELRIKL
jgi:hypothetical protein